MLSDSIHFGMFDPDMLVPGPQFKDGCNHGLDKLLCSISYQDIQVDLYMFTHKGSTTQRICVRYGDGDSEYLSSRTIVDILYSAAHLQGKQDRLIACILCHILQANYTKELQ